MKRYVNGVEVEMTPEEQAAIEAEWSANAAKRRRERSIEAIETQLAGLTNARFLRMVRRIVAERLQADPGFAARLGEAIPGDEAAT